jgi:hypothetical protein
LATERAARLRQLLIQVGPTALATRTLRRPLTPELGETSVEVLVNVRSNREVPRWLEYDDVRLTDQEIITTVRPNFSWKGVICIPLVDVVAVDVRPGTPRDNPWIRLDDDLAYDVPPGDVVAIHHRRGIRVLPGYDAAAFADVIRVRVGKVQSSMAHVPCRTPIKDERPAKPCGEVARRRCSRPGA